MNNLNNLNLIVAVDKNNGIGVGNKMPWSHPKDMAWFKQKTLGHSVIMGANTFESILSSLGKPLPGRRNIILSRKMRDISQATNSNYALDFCNNWASLEDIICCNEKNQFFLIGGAQVYKEFGQKAKTLYVTHIEASYGCDTFIDLKEMLQGCQLTQEIKDTSLDGKSQVDLRFCTYTRES